MKPNKRKQRFVDRRVQGALLVQVICHWLVFLGGTFALLFCVHLLFGEPNRTASDHVSALWSRHAPFLFVALAFMPAFIYDVVKMGRRFVGPVMRVREGLRRLAQGQAVTPITLRKNDFWHDLADDFNAALATIDREKTTSDGTQSDLDEDPNQNHEPEFVNAMS